MVGVLDDDITGAGPGPTVSKDPVLMAHFAGGGWTASIATQLLVADQQYFGYFPTSPLLFYPLVKRQYEQTSRSALATGCRWLILFAGSTAWKDSPAP